MRLRSTTIVLAAAVVAACSGSSAGSSGAKGTFKVTLNSDHITGSFDAVACTPAKTSGGCM